jgi:uncharacterized membrane protein
MALATIVVPWAFLTSALEWLLLVPILPFAQPIFTLQQPYWIGFLVHLASALVYPVFAVFRTWVTGRRSSSTGVVKVWSAGLATSLLLCALLALAGVTGHELRLMGRIRMETGRSSATWRRIMSRGSNSLASPSRERATPIFGRLRD